MSIGKNSITRAADSIQAPKSVQKKANTVAQPLSSVYLSVACSALQTFRNAKADPALTESVRKYGIMEPLAVCRISSGALYLIAGYRRFAAACALKLEEVPARVFDAADEKEAKKLYQMLQKFSDMPRENLHEVKFTAIVSLPDEMPDYLL